MMGPEWVPYRLPLVEGKCPPVSCIDENGQAWSRYTEPNPGYVDPEIKEFDMYRIEDVEEFYDYVTVCKNCGTRFIAYQEHDLILKFCPGCGGRLEVEE